MKDKAIKIRLSIIVGTILGILILGVWFSTTLPLWSLAQEIHPQYVADFSDDKVLVGASHNIFVGKVKEETGNKHLGKIPETQYSVEVIENIKGNLEGVVSLNQEGGFMNGVMYSINEVANDEKYLLQPGSTYLFATRYNEQENWYTLNSYPTARKLLSSDANMSIEQLKIAVSSVQRVQELKAAYPNEKVLDADIQHNNARNSYNDFKAEQARTDTDR